MLEIHPAWPDKGEGGEHNRVNFVEIAGIFLMQDPFLTISFQNRLACEHIVSIGGCTNSKTSLRVFIS